jgi:hypothetical protein
MQVTGLENYEADPPQAQDRPSVNENGKRRQCEAISEERLAARLEKVTERLPAGRRWSRQHAHTQRRLCERFAVPVIGGMACQDIKTWHMQQVVNARAYRRGGCAGARDDLGPGRRGHRGRVPGQPSGWQRCTGRPPAPGPVTAEAAA